MVGRRNISPLREQARLCLRLTEASSNIESPHNHCLLIWTDSPSIFHQARWLPIKSLQITQFLLSSTSQEQVLCNPQEESSLTHQESSNQTLHQEKCLSSFHESHTHLRAAVQPATTLRHCLACSMRQSTNSRGLLDKLESNSILDSM